MAQLHDQKTAKLAMEKKKNARIKELEAQVSQLKKQSGPSSTPLKLNNKSRAISSGRNASTSASVTPGEHAKKASSSNLQVIDEKTADVAKKT